MKKEREWNGGEGEWEGKRGEGRETGKGKGKDGEGEERGEGREGEAFRLEHFSIYTPG